MPGLIASLAHRLAVLLEALGLGHPIRALLAPVLVVIQLRRYAAKIFFLGNSATIPGLILLTRAKRILFDQLCVGYCRGALRHETEGLPRVWSLRRWSL